LTDSRAAIGNPISGAVRLSKASCSGGPPSENRRSGPWWTRRVANKPKPQLIPAIAAKNRDDQQTNIGEHWTSLNARAIREESRSTRLHDHGEGAK
jgi:hypothetical protein